MASRVLATYRTGARRILIWVASCRSAGTSSIPPRRRVIWLLDTNDGDGGFSWEKTDLADTLRGMA